ncbi:MAG TPA: hypothetical protein VK615_00360 [Candidatus Binatia bacterium]|nr:hypothetical protein [Candidatus Binatia bacterium]
MSWAGPYGGSRLEFKSVSVTTTGMWFTVPGSTSTNLLFVPINAAASTSSFGWFIRDGNTDPLL